ncbi:hypothetical protein OH77DRAFT_431009 [Trametes cingulata]|nr:hypothetical protein OH77DRAFT_431009 [Trametes cingulata]
MRLLQRRWIRRGPRGPALHEWLSHNSHGGIGPGVRSIAIYPQVSLLAFLASNSRPLTSLPSPAIAPSPMTSLSAALCTRSRCARVRSSFVHWCCIRQLQ